MEIKTEDLAYIWYRVSHPGRELASKSNHDVYVQELHFHRVGYYAGPQNDYGHWDLQRVATSDIFPHYEGLFDGKSGSRIAEYADRKLKGSEFPPIIIKPHPTLPGKWITVDGVHRLASAKSVGATHLEAYVPVESSLNKR